MKNFKVLSVIMALNLSGQACGISLKTLAACLLAANTSAGNQPWNKYVLLGDFTTSFDSNADHALASHEPLPLEIKRQTIDNKSSFSCEIRQTYNECELWYAGQDSRIYVVSPRNHVHFDDIIASTYPGVYAAIETAPECTTTRHHEHGTLTLKMQCPDAHYELGPLTKAFDRTKIKTDL